MFASKARAGKTVVEGELCLDGLDILGDRLCSGFSALEWSTGMPGCCEQLLRNALDLAFQSATHAEQSGLRRAVGCLVTTLRHHHRVCAAGRGDDAYSLRLDEFCREFWISCAIGGLRQVHARIHRRLARESISACWEDPSATKAEAPPAVA